MKLFGLEIRREHRSVEDPRVAISDTDGLLAFFGIGGADLPVVTLESALTVPAYASAVAFLAATLANLPLHAYRDKGEAGSERITGALQRILNEAPNPEWTSFGLRQYLWRQVFTAGRGLAWIERSGSNPAAIWPMDATATTVKRINGRKWYCQAGRDPYPAADVIDVPFMLKNDQLGVHAPLTLLAKSLQLSLAMTAYAAGFFASGGVPPLALVGPLPAGTEATKRAQKDIKAAMAAARNNGDAVFPIPPGYDLKPVGFDPTKGQMKEARQFQVEEISRVLNLPPVFVGDLTHGTLTNTEQQDLHLTKHLIARHAKAFEEELNLKLFGAAKNSRYVEHALDALMRGDFKTRMEGLARGVQNALLTPNEARALDNRGAKPGGDELMIQGATVPIGTQPKPSAPTDPAPPQGDPETDPETEASADA